MKNKVSSRACLTLRDITRDKSLRSTLTTTLFILALLVFTAQVYAVNSSGLAQTRVQGTVTNETGTPLSGVSILEKGTPNGTTTDENGQFNIQVQNMSATLVIRYIGYLEQEVDASTGPLTIVLEESTATLDEVVVVGYGTQKRANLTGSVASVDAEVLDSRPIVNLAQGLQGTIPNLNVNMGNGAPGRGASFNVRGVSSISGTDQPLVLVDGVVMDPNLINPADVESVSVLKDAGSAAIYGGRAAFGVILITTKSGARNSPMRLSFNSSYNLSRETYMPDYINSVDYISMHREADRTGGLTAGSRASTPFTELDSINAALYLSDPANNLSVYIDPANPTRYRYVGNTDWLGELYPGWAPMFDNTLSLNGGSEKIGYVASLGYMSQDGLLKAANQNYSRYNGSLRLNAEATSWLDLNFRAQLNRSNLNTANATQFAEGQAHEFAFIPSDLRPVMPIKHPDGNWAGQGSFTNMIALMEENGRLTEVRNDLWLTGGFVLKPIKNVRVVGDFSWNNYRFDKDQVYRAFPEYGPNGVYVGLYPWTNPDRIIRRNDNDSYHAINTFAEYENTFASKHYFKAIAGFAQELKQLGQYTITARNQLSPDLGNLTPNNDPTPISAALTAPASEWALRSGFFRVNYIYDDRYLVEVNGRYDATSRFARGNRTVFTPSVSLAWRISQEAFFDPLLPYVNDLKFRASYGTLPNQLTTSAYPYLATMPTGTTPYLFGNQLGLVVGVPGLVSSNFTWEEVTTLNFGIDVAALNNRLIANFDLFTRETLGMITAGFQVPAVLGTAVPQRNAADMKTRGWELALTWRDRVGSDFRYGATLALSDYMGEVTRFHNPTGNINQYYVGREMGEIWGFETDGFFATDAEAAAADQSQLFGGTWLAGDIKYVDLDGNNSIDFGTNTLENPGDRKIIGNSTPRYQFGLNLNLEYKGFDFTTFFQGVGKRDFSVGGNYFWGLTSEWDVPMAYHTDYWTPNNPNAYYPRLRFGGGNTQTQTKYLQNAAYARLKQLTLGYTLPATVLERAKINRLRVFVTGQNLFTITNMHEAFDPELLGAQSYPLSKTWSLGLQLGL